MRKLSPALTVAFATAALLASCSRTGLSSTDDWSRVPPDPHILFGTAVEKADIFPVDGRHLPETITRLSDVEFVKITPAQGAVFCACALTETPGKDVYLIRAVSFGENSGSYAIRYLNGNYEVSYGLYSRLDRQPVKTPVVARLSRPPLHIYPSASRVE